MPYKNQQTMSFLKGSSRSFRVWHPKDPDKIEVISCQFVDKAAPPEVKEAPCHRPAGLWSQDGTKNVRQPFLNGAVTRRYALNYQAAGALEQDDMDNWQECTRSNRGAVTRRYALSRTTWAWATTGSTRIWGLGPAISGLATATRAIFTSGGPA